jgi:hypothetical protein
LDGKRKRAWLPGVSEVGSCIFSVFFFQVLPEAKESPTLPTQESTGLCFLSILLGRAEVPWWKLETCFHPDRGTLTRPRLLLMEGSGSNIPSRDFTCPTDRLQASGLIFGIPSAHVGGWDSRAAFSCLSHLLNPVAPPPQPVPGRGMSTLSHWFGDRVGKDIPNRTG